MSVKKKTEKAEVLNPREARFAGIPNKTEKVSRELSCTLTSVQWNAKAHELATAHSATEAQKTRKKSVMADLNADLKSAEAKETKLSNIVSTNQEQRDVTVEVTYNYEDGLIIETRTDTGEEISRREMTTSERQSSLFEEQGVDANDLIESRHEDDGPIEE